jgi:hypothetical protein
MGKIVVTEFVSLDGVIEDPGGVEDFTRGGCNEAVSRGDDGDRRREAVPGGLGAGKRLFSETSDTKSWRLAESKAIGDGVMILIYQRADTR